MQFRIPPRYIENIKIISSLSFHIADSSNINSFIDGEPISIIFDLSKTLDEYARDNDIEIDYSRSDKFIFNQKLIDIHSNVKNKCDLFVAQIDETVTSAIDAEILCQVTKAMGDEELIDIFKEQYSLYAEMNSNEEFTMMVMSI